MNELRPFLRAYASVLFCESAAVGAWFALVTWFTPRAAIAGVIGLAFASLWARLLSLSAPAELHLVNSLLTGLVLGAFHVLDLRLVAWIAIATLFVTLVTRWLGDLLWRAGRLPVMSLPFVLAVWGVALAGQIGNGAMMPAPMTGAAGTVFWPWTDQFFASLGWLLLVPYPLAGALLFAGLLVASRYLALLAVAGYVAGELVIALGGRGDAPSLGFNYMLAAMALGGIFAVPGRASFLVAMAGGATAAWFAGALAVLSQPYHLPLLTLPFVGAVYLWLGGLGARTSSGAPQLTLAQPAAPELAYERVRLAQARGGAGGSIALHPPYFGEWRVSQGFDGRHTHRPPWQHALDFDIAEGGKPHAGNGLERSDYFCFGAPVLAPVAAQVARLRDELPDVSPGAVDVKNNWGNFLLLKTAGGDHVLLSHLKLGSILVHVGEWVSVGQRIAACGSSGRSPEPHLHLHVQGDEALGSPTRPFHLTNVILREADGSREFRLFHRPQEGEILSAAPRDERIAAAVVLPAGRSLRYRVEREGTAASVELRSGLTLLGQSRLSTDGDASAAFEVTPAVQGFYDRAGPRDALLDLWLLALGLTPLSASADLWHDRPPARLLPLGPMARVLVALLRPLGAACESTYRRAWDDRAHAWRQEGEHRLRLLPGLGWIAQTSAWIEPGGGVRRLGLRMPGADCEAVLEP